MSRTILANVDGFTPVIDGLVEELGLMSAVVFGRVWRYCQMEDHVCRASLERIAASIGVDRATVMRHIKDLCDRGYLEDLTPDVRNRPHVYRDTGKAGLTLSLSGVAQSNTSEKGIAESKTAVAESHSTVAQSNRGVAESHLKKVFKKEIKKEEETVDGPDLQVWQRVIDQLQPNMSHSSFETHVRDTVPVRYGRNTLFVLAQNTESREWLEARVQRSAERLLVGILKQEVSVSFLVAEKVS